MKQSNNPNTERSTVYVILYKRLWHTVTCCVQSWVTLSKLLCCEQVII